MSVKLEFLDQAWAQTDADLSEYMLIEELINRVLQQCRSCWGRWEGGIEASRGAGRGDVGLPPPASLLVREPANAGWNWQELSPRQIIFCGTGSISLEILATGCCECSDFKSESLRSKRCGVSTWKRKSRRVSKYREDILGSGNLWSWE